MNNSTISNTENFENPYIFTQIGIVYGLFTIGGIAVFLGTWNENNINNFQIYLLRILNNNIWLYRLLFILSIIFYIIFISALTFILCVICFIYFGIREIICGFYECCCCLASVREIVPSSSNDMLV
jgi:hypothetical protein